ncbi:DUF3592 domain-containing protein [Sphaerisporangium sp. NPDC049003]|uniref:DUF3592 domain-containing protein n=1 Tax=Sphaerisporangium sp. NPDC049003 TaxID=3364517 RepID=UPI00371A8E37
MSVTAWLVLAFGLAALVFGGVGAGLLLSQRDFRRIAHRVPGQVVRLRPSHSSEGTVYYPTIRFTTADGRPVEVEGNVGSSPPIAPVGAEVPVLYDPARPDRMRVDTMLGGNLIGMVFAGTGAVFLVVCIAVVAFGG